MEIMTLEDIIKETERIRSVGLSQDQQAMALMNLTIDLNRVYQCLGDIHSLAVKNYDLSIATRKTKFANEYLKSKTSGEKITDKVSEAQADSAIENDRNYEAECHAYQEQLTTIKDVVKELVMSLKKKADIITQLSTLGG